MRAKTLLLIGALLTLGIVFVLMRRGEPRVEVPPKASPTIEARLSPMKIESPAFKHNEHIPAKYTCDAENINPPLTIADVPAEAKSLVLIMDDPDAPRGTWVHWTVWNIVPETTGISENSVPARAVEGMTSFGKSGYGGPCPPSGVHRYFFKLYALDTMLELPPSADKAKLEGAMAGYILMQTELVGLYQRR